MNLRLSVPALLACAPAVAQDSPTAAPPAVDEALIVYADMSSSVRLAGGRMLHIVCMGEGSPTVIMTAGAGGWSITWRTVQPRIAKMTRACAWDRAGFGLSDPSPAEQTVEATTDDLEVALASGALPGPYVLVGHSLGSYESLLFTDRHPDQVAGIVLVDPSFPDQFAELGRIAPLIRELDYKEGPATIARLGRCAAATRDGTLARGHDPENCRGAPPTYPPALVDALQSKLDNPSRYETVASFLAAVQNDTRLVINAARNYHDTPLIVLTATDVTLPPGISSDAAAQAPAFAQAWNQAHDRLAALSTRGVNARVPGTSHFIHQSKPQVVTDAIAAVLAQARAAGD